MCSRYSLTSPPDAVRAYFGYRNTHDFPPRYNIAPTQPVAIVRLADDGGRELALVRWGLIPSWAKDLSKLSTMINARAESAAEKPSFRGSLRHRRCLIPADGFYEWMGVAGAKRPHLVRRKDGGMLAFAGLWEHWLGADGSEIDTMAILTTGSNVALSWFHDRMPALLEPERFEPWLDCRAVRAEAAIDLLQPVAEDLLEVVEVSKLLNSPHNEGPAVQQPTGTQRLL